MKKDNYKIGFAKNDEKIRPINQKYLEKLHKNEKMHI